MFYHHGFGITGFLGSLLMIIMMALPLILVVWVSFYLYDKVGRDKSKRSIDINSSIPEIRLAQGELSIEEYRQVKKKRPQNQPSDT